MDKAPTLCTCIFHMRKLGGTVLCLDVASLSGFEARFGTGKTLAGGVINWSLQYNLLFHFLHWHVALNDFQGV